MRELSGCTTDVEQKLSHHERNVGGAMLNEVSPDSSNDERDQQGGRVKSNIGPTPNTF